MRSKHEIILAIKMDEQGRVEYMLDSKVNSPSIIVEMILEVLLCVTRGQIKKSPPKKELEHNATR